jgi:spermidine/putrescine transport system substrate-binding protein
MNDHDRARQTGILDATPLSRRQVLIGGALAGTSAFLAACGTRGTTSSPSASESASASASASGGAGATPSPTLAWANWTYYIDVSESDPNVHPTLEKFKAQYGTTVDYQEVIEDNDSFYGQIKDALAAGKDSGWDIVTLTDWMAARIIRLGWAEDFDLANMPHFAANLKDEYKSVAWDSGAKKHAPWQSGMTGLGFDPAVTGELTSLKSFFTPDPRWNGKVEYLTEARDTLGLTMLSLGLDPAEPTREGCDQAIAVLQKAKDDGIVRSLKGNSYAEDLKSGDAVLVMAWSGDMVQVLVDKPGLKFVIGDEGGMLWTDNMLIPKGAAHKGTAELLIDYYYQPEVAAEVEAYVNYICPVKGAEEAMKARDPEIANNPLIFPPAELSARLRIFGALDEADERYVNEQFAKVLGVG